MAKKERFLTVMNGKTADRIPVFPLLMSFSAKNYGATYREFASNGKIMAESQISVMEKYNVDAITACSDAFRISADLGGEIVFPEDKPPHLARPLVKNESDFRHLKKPDLVSRNSRMADRILGTRDMVRAVGNSCMVLGWVDMPFAESCSVCGVSEFMMMLYDEPELAHRILDFLTDIVIEFAIAQIQTGAPMVGAGDAAASLLSPAFYREFALPYEQKVCEAVHHVGGLVKLHMCGNTSNLLGSMVLSGADLYNIDHMVDFENAVDVYSVAGKAFKGNLDPVADLLQSTPEECQRKAKELIQKAAGKKYILSAGCEIPAEVNPEVFVAFCDSVK